MRFDPDRFRPEVGQHLPRYAFMPFGGGPRICIGNHFALMEGQTYKDAGYFSRNVRAIEVLIDRKAITSGAAASGTPWRYYDLGHGWCSYEFFEQCPHRMACARCDFYVPKESDRGLWLQTRDGLLKLLQEIPLSDEERAAVDGDVQALDRLLDQLKDVPTPSQVSSQKQHPFIPLHTIRSAQQE